MNHVNQQLKEISLVNTLRQKAQCFERGGLTVPLFFVILYNYPTKE